MTETNLSSPDNVIQTHRFQYCPMCKAPLRRDPLFADNILHTHCTVCGWIQLVSNCICVAAIVKHNSGIVVLQPPDGEGEGFPAGIVEYGENPQDAVIRETLEETGLVVEIVRELGWSFVSYEDFPGPTVNVFFETRSVGGELREGDEGPVKVIALKDLPPISPNRHDSYMALKRYLDQFVNDRTPHD
jgi:8-oxo-dGTP diphosphatase